MPVFTISWVGHSKVTLAQSASSLAQQRSTWPRPRDGLSISDIAWRFGTAIAHKGQSTKWMCGRKIWPINKWSRNSIPMRTSGSFMRMVISLSVQVTAEAQPSIWRSSSWFPTKRRCTTRAMPSGPARRKTDSRTIASIWEQDSTASTLNLTLFSNRLPWSK